MLLFVWQKMRQLIIQKRFFKFFSSLHKIIYWQKGIFKSREKTGAEWTDLLLDMYMEEPVENWGLVLDNADFPPIRTGMCGFFATALTIFYPPDTVDLVSLL